MTDRFQKAMPVQKAIEAVAARLNAPERAVAERAQTFRQCREATGMNQLQFGRALGMCGQSTSVRQMISQRECGHEPIGERTYRLALMFGMHGIPALWDERESD